MTNLTSIIATGINNPECSFFVGSFLGEFVAVRNIILLGLTFFLIKTIDKLLIEPVLNKIKEKLNIK